MYGLNPFLLFEMITNVHNDIYLIFFIILSLYFVLRKRNIILAIAFMTFATCIKYVAVLLMPFMVMYFYKDKNTLKKILYSVSLACLFLILFFAIYYIYGGISTNAFIQQEKYRESILAIVLFFTSKRMELLSIIKGIFISAFLYYFIICIIKMLVEKDTRFSNYIKKYNYLLLIFIFLIITNLCPWYMSWLIPTMFWLKGKQIKNILYLQFSYELVTLINFVFYSEDFRIGILYLPIILSFIVIANLKDNKNLKYIENKE